MSNGFATGLTVNSTNICTGSYFFRIVVGFGEQWEVRGEDITIPTVDGQTAFPRKRHRLLIVAKGWVQGGTSTASAQLTAISANMAVIRALMAPTQSPYTITHVDEGGTSHSITARPLAVDWDPEAPIPTRRDAALTWVAIGADWT